MKCAVHPDVEATGYCRNCGKPMCPACVRPVRDVLYCEECLAKVVGLPPVAAPASLEGSVTPGLPVPLPPPPPGSGTPVLAFILGLIPGLGAIYNGEYNKALLHIVIFAGIILGITLDLGGGAEAVLICALVIFPFYMAIDAVRTVKARQTGDSYQDPLENWTKQRGLGPILLIALGALFLLRNFGFFDIFRLRELFFPIVLIGLGVWLLRNRMSGQS
ncbi:MAG TPA: B-box zinc finger protein [Candidatus Acidoferrum sp.]|nr:B-box zinc finger protein [Candidatus Acidoferrum sp.]